MSVISQFDRVRRYKIDQRGVTAIEYGLLALLVAVGIVAAVSLTGQKTEQTFCTVAGAIGSAPSGCGSTAPTASTVIPASYHNWAPMPAGTTCVRTPTQTSPAIYSSYTGVTMTRYQYNVNCTEPNGTIYSSAGMSNEVYSKNGVVTSYNFNGEITNPATGNVSFVAQSVKSPTISASGTVTGGVSQNMTNFSSPMTATSTPYVQFPGYSFSDQHCVNQTNSSLTSTQAKMITANGSGAGAWTPSSGTLVQVCTPT